MSKNKKSTPKKSIFQFLKNRQTQTVFSLMLMFFGLALILSFSSYFIFWEADQSTVEVLFDKRFKAKNLLGKWGADISHLLLYKGFGVASYLIVFQLFYFGKRLLFRQSLKKAFNSLFWTMISMIWIATTFGFARDRFPLLAGVIGIELNEFISIYIGKTGLILLLALGYFLFGVLRLKINPETIALYFKNKLEKKVTQNLKNEFDNENKETLASEDIQVNNDQDHQNDDEENTKSTITKDFENLKPTIKNTSTLNKESNRDEEESSPEEENTIDLTIDSTNLDSGTDISESEIEIAVTKSKEEKVVGENLANKLVKDFGEFDPKLELGQFKFPTLNLLKEYNESIAVNAEELSENKNKIVDTLRNYKIGIAKIKATVGPTVTLYEIVPDAGIRISKIKSLEDDIALSLSALGIRIIAPIPGKGTIGIEVPNTKSTIVSMHSMMASKKFQESKMELPIAIGKTISNETLVVDLCKMPHLLMAGATGQGKSVGLNVILTSILYKKHPAEVKFVLVDPKKVELTLFNKIERHYLAKLPDNEEAIITDTSKVVKTVNSLCVEMDNRYELLKKAMVRNIKEYNKKFRERKLNPENGHAFLPYIVLVIDEFADLIMTAGKEIETPIARLAQLARAIGIHLIVATQRPSVNVITGIIKANFPSRIAFRVTSKIDSRTILDASGADQLIGKGDMLYSGGSDLIRIQCAFVDTPEIEKITDYIGSQKAYPEAHLLPEYEGEGESGINLADDPSDRDPLFKEAAEIIVNAQQGSTSLLQRKLRLGYNRAGRLIDQLEAAKIVGPFEGSKAREVLIPDVVTLQQLLDNK